MPFQNKSKWSFLLSWVLATTIGAAVGTAMRHFIENRIPSSETSFEMIRVFFLFRLLVANFAGMLAVCLQWAVLGTFDKRSNAWLVMGLIGWSFPFAGILLLQTFPVKNIGFAFDFSTDISGISYAGALAAGFLQWLTMRKWARRASWWILANLTAWILAKAIPSTLGALIGLFLYFRFVIPEAVPPSVYGLMEFSTLFSGISIGIITGITTGITMLLLLKSTTLFLNSPMSAA
jgi:hypothetical protein